MGAIEWFKELFGDKDPVTVTVKLTAPTQANVVYLGTQKLQFDSQKTSNMPMTPGSYSLFWTIKGLDGQSYSLEITAPKSAEWKSEDRTIVGTDGIGVHGPVEVK